MQSDIHVFKINYVFCTLKSAFMIWNDLNLLSPNTPVFICQPWKYFYLISGSAVTTLPAGGLPDSHYVSSAKKEPKYKWRIAQVLIAVDFILIHLWEGKGKEVMEDMIPFRPDFHAKCVHAPQFCICALPEHIYMLWWCLLLVFDGIEMVVLKCDQWCVCDGGRAMAKCK